MALARRSLRAFAILVAIALGCPTADAGRVAAPRMAAARPAVAPARTPAKATRAALPPIAAGRRARGGPRGRAALPAVFAGLPATARVVELPPSVFRDAGRPIELGESRGSTGGRLGRRGVDDLRQQLVRATRGRPVAETVVYPASGYDAGFAATLFADATTLVGIDNHPFAPVGLGPRSRIAVPDVAPESVTYFGNVDRAGTMVAALVGSLRHMIPGFRLRHVAVIETSERVPGREVRRFGSYIQLGEVGTGAAEDASTSASHGVLEFDSGPGTPVRRYVHLQGALVGHQPLASWWWDGLTQLRPDAFLVKGAESLFRQREVQPVREALVRLLAERRGLVVEGGSGESILDWNEQRRSPPLGLLRPARGDGYVGYAGSLTVRAVDPQVVEPR